ncbi:peptidylprolyl isomerase [Pontibacter qinzhouensis]|uniref:Peptidyl-prolyl cis-trans isomerase n=1 Tax=Pontibacter qinzhouensis TaxID=2603253 RepID=A0A5C8K5W9_9BACT|nr:FKBP-type peptidyl-prolyl cis-trans isomerase [Pontibacter qinzhouensis]TXK46453.1 peptidylprolyl isomerase [Pontibacter qinzhouensis]
MRLLPFITNSSPKSILVKVFFFFMVAASFSACKEPQNPYRNRCYPTLEEKLAQKPKDIDVIKKHFREKGVDTTNMQSTSSGLHYVILDNGTGDQVKKGDRVLVHYFGKTLDGYEFDNSRQSRDPQIVNSGFSVQVGVSQVIEGWHEALELMKVGDDIRFYIPSYLAYGPCGSAGAIGSNEVLIFEIQLLRIVK